MSELNREQLIKALECCTSGNSVSACMSGCPLFEQEDCECVNDDTALLKYALALIKELTEDLHATRTELTRVQGDTINKFADRLKKYYSNLKDTTLSSMVAYHIDQIAKEMLEG